MLKEALPDLERFKVQTVTPIHTWLQVVPYWSRGDVTVESKATSETKKGSAVTSLLKHVK